MKTYMLWHGGGSYAIGTIPDDLEAFDTFSAAKEEFRRRGQDSDPYYPCVEDSSAWIFFAEPGSDPYPDMVLSFGPRGGVKVAR